MSRAVVLRTAALMGSIACGVVFLVAAAVTALAAFLSQPGTTFDGDLVMTGWATLLAVVAAAVALASGGLGLMAAGVAHRALPSAGGLLHATVGTAAASVGLAGVATGASPGGSTVADAAVILMAVAVAAAGARAARNGLRGGRTPVADGVAAARLVLLTAGLAAMAGGLIYLPFCLDAPWDRGEVVGGSLLTFTGIGVGLVGVAIFIPASSVGAMGNVLLIGGLCAAGAGVAGIASSFSKILWIVLGVVATMTGVDITLLAGTLRKEATNAPVTKWRTVGFAAIAMPVGAELLAISLSLLFDRRLTAARWSAGMGTDAVLAGLAVEGLAALAIGLIAWRRSH